MSPREYQLRPRELRRRLLAVGLGGMIAAGTLTTGVARADTVTGEGIFMPRGSMAKQFGGVFCPCSTVSSMPTSVASQVRKLDTAVQAELAKGQHVTLAGYSLSAAAVHQVIDGWLETPETAPDPGKVRIITTGNPLNRYGGTQRNQANAVPLPTSQPYEHLDVVMAYDSVADRPTRQGYYSQREISLRRHMAYTTADINAPENLVRQDGNTTYMLIPAAELQSTKWIKPWVSADRYAEIEADRREKIEADYTRPVLHPQGEGADWANDIKPQSLREESSLPSRSGSSATKNESASNSDVTPTGLMSAGSRFRGDPQDGDTTAPTGAGADTSGGESDSGADA